MVPAVFVPENVVSYSLLLDAALDVGKALVSTAVDLDNDEPTSRELLVPPDQVVPERRAVLSEVELKPDDLPL